MVERQQRGPDEEAGVGQAPEAVAAVIADATTADTGRQELLVEYARRLGPDPELAGLDDDEVADAVRTGAAELAAATCRWLGHLAELVVRERWSQDGATSPAAWLSWAIGMAPSTAREHIRVALRLRECPQVRARMAAGRLSYSKARAITRVATPATEALLLDWADGAPAHVLERIIADTRRTQLAQTPAAHRPDLGVTRRWRDDGTYELIVRVDSGTGLAIDQHLDRLLDVDETPTDGEQSVDEEQPVASRRLPRSVRAADLVAGALAAAVATGPDDTSGGDRHLVVVHAEVTELLAASEPDAEPSDPTDAERASAEAPRRRHLVRDGRQRVRAMSARTLWRLACTASIDVQVSDDGHPADLGRARRAPDARLRRLLAARDRTCRFPGCGATRYLHAHHVVHWEHGGATDLDNLVLLCNHHHHVVHDRGWDLRSAGPGRWTFHPPTSAAADSPTAAQSWSRPLPGASAEALRAAARAHATEMDPETARTLLQPPHWDGDGHDHDLAIAILADRLAAAA